MRITYSALITAVAAFILSFHAHAQSTFYSNSTTGNVGIGTTNPQSLLHIYNGEAQVGSSGASCVAANNGAIRFGGSALSYCTGTTWTTLGTAGSLPSLTSGDIWVGNGSNAATAVALSGDCTISNAGAITCTKTNGTAFGTLATQYAVNLSTQATGTLQAAQFPALTGDVTTTAGSLATTVASIRGTAVSGTTGTGNVVFSASPTLTGTVTGANANWSGNVGIGTTMPVTTLDLESGAATFNGGGAQNYNAPAVRFPNGNPIVFYKDASTVSGTEYADSNGDLFMYSPNNINFTTVNSTIMYITSGAKVGILTKTPSYTLQVNGSVAGASAYVNTSDVRHKKNIEPLKYGLNEVAQLKPVRFEWKDDNRDVKKLGTMDVGMQGQQIGFIAQDVEKILPSVVVTEPDAEKTKGMKYSELIPVLTKAIQELKADNDNLRQDFEDYKKAHP